jgi:rRNA-processing protein FCF1
LAVLTKKENKAKEEAPKHIVQVPTALFFQYNTQLGPPYHVLIDTNFINFSIKNKLEIYKSMMDCLLAKCIPCVTDCVMAELEKLGTKYRLALRLAKDPRFERLPCTHSGTYADDCLLQRCQQHRCYIVATCDKELKRKIRKVRKINQSSNCYHINSLSHHETLLPAPNLMLNSLYYISVFRRFLEFPSCLSTAGSTA